MPSAADSFRPAGGTICLGLRLLLIGHSLVPLPPATINAYLMPIRVLYMPVLVNLDLKQSIFLK